MKRLWINTLVLTVLGLLVWGCNGDKKIKGTTPPPGGGGEGDDTLGLGKGKARPRMRLTKKEKKSYQKAVNVYLESAENAEKSGGWNSKMCSRAAAAFNDVAETNPRLYAHGKHNAGVSWLHCEKKDKARKAFQAALGKKPSFSPSLVSMGYLKAEQGKEKAAYSMFEKAYLADMRNAEASYNLGVIYREKAKAGKKITPSEKQRLYALRTPSGHFAYRDWVQKKLQPRNKELSYKELALRHLQTVLAITSGADDPSGRLLNLKAYSMMALVYVDAADKMRSQLALANLVIEEANKIVDRYAKKHKRMCSGKAPNAMEKSIAELKNVHGLVALKQKEKNLVAAMKRFTAAVQCNPRFWEAHMNIGAIALGFRGYKRAKASFEVVLEQQPNLADAVMGLGVAYRGLSALAMGDVKDKLIAQTEQQYKKVQKLARPQSNVYADATYNLGLLYQDYKIGDSDAANKKRLRTAMSFFKKYTTHPQAEPAARKNAKSRIKDIKRTIKIMEQMADLKRKQAERERRRKEQERLKKQNQPRPRGTRPPARDKGKKGKARPAGAR